MLWYFLLLFSATFNPFTGHKKVPICHFFFYIIVKDYRENYHDLRLILNVNSYKYYNIFTAQFVINQLIFAIGYFDSTLTRNFVTCLITKQTTNASMPDNLWAINQPDNKGGIQSCIAVNFAVKKHEIGFDDISCVEQVNGICQVFIIIYFLFFK
jgi:hypothetical protein